MALKRIIVRLKESALRRRDALLTAAIYCGAAGLAALALLFGPTHLIGLTETSAFCGLCHSMERMHSDWEHSAHRSAKCIDCHLPNDNAANHYFWKTIDGNKDVFFEFSGLREYDEIKLSAHGHRVLQANCIRCHKDMVARIDNERSCTDCHRSAGHKLQGITAVREDMK